MYHDTHLISTGSAFFYVHADRWFLITNWHNLSGRHFISKQPVSESKIFPTHLEVHLSSYEAGASLSMPEGSFTTVSMRVDIYQDHEPKWYEHPDIGSMCDVIALPLERPSHCPEFMHNAANLITTTKIPIKPGVTAFVIGFPKSISVGFGLPLWKSGYIASEPHYDVTTGGALARVGGLTGGMQLPAFFLDTQTREGMSGAPVFASYTGTWDMSDPYRDVDPTAPDFFSRDDVALGGNGMEFIGCYSGRVGKTEEGAALGLCWRVDAIEKICSSKHHGTHPHVTASEA